ncbi:MAG: arginine deiminase family protein [Candidatus Micrarchaeia archaeon]
MNQLTTIARPEAGGKNPPFRGRKLHSEGINLLGTSIRCQSEDGELKKVLVQPPDFLSWTSKTAINQLQRTHDPPSVSQVKEEHDMLVDALTSEGAEVISVKPKPRLSEGVYQRDSVFVIGQTAFSARFKHRKRWPETTDVSGTVNPWRNGDIIEGGDILVFPEAVLVGLGDRTNMMAVQTLRKIISDKEIIPVPLVKGTLHLDYATTIGGRGKMRTMTVCPDLYKDKEMIRAIADRFSVGHMIPVPHDQHYLGWANLVYVNPETVISTTAAREVNVALRKIGFKVIEIPFDGILSGEGAPRCCTAPLEREH